MNVIHKDFIAQYTDVYPEGYCQHLISEFERLANGGAGANRKQSENASANIKNDYQIFLSIKSHACIRFNGEDVVDLFFAGLQKCYDEYIDKYSTLKDAKIKATHMKMQRTDSGGGYHAWHCEQNNSRMADRVLVYMLYLNTMQPQEAGETEFLYQQTRISPQKNKMILWPAAYTHTHRGNTVFGNNSKYVVTGWFYYE